MSRLFSTTLFALVIAPSYILDADVIDDWRLRHPTPYYANFWHAAYGNGVYVAVGVGGMIATSSDLEGWHSVHHPQLLENVVFGDGQFVATGSDGDILTSPDGTNWIARASGTSFALSGVDYGNGVYVAAGDHGVTAVSSNGVNWTISSAGATNFWYWGVAYGAGRFVAVATDADYNGPINIVTSTNGVDWIEATLPGGLPAYTELWGVAYANGRFIAVGYWEIETSPGEYIWGPLVLTSTDGTNWTRVNDPDFPMTDNQWVLWAVGYDGTQWVGVGQNGLVMTSADGLDWSLLPTPLGTTPEFYGLAFGPGGQIVAVGGYGTVYSTSNLTTWGRHFSGAIQGLSRIAFNGGQYLAGGPNAYISSDGITWSPYHHGLGGTITGIAYGKGRWVISSSTIFGGSTHYPLSSSTNGVDWTLAATSAGFRDCLGVAFGNDIFVAIPTAGSNSLAYSTDGISWTETSHPWFTNHIGRVGLAFGGGQFLAWLNQYYVTVEVAISVNGMDWQTNDTGVIERPNAGAYGDGRWVLAGDEGKVMTSTDMVNWSGQTIQFDGATYDLRGVTFGGGHWIIVGSDQHIWSSTDGENWDEAFTTQLSDLIFSDATFDGSSFWVVGSRGAIYQSAPLVTMTAPTLAIRKASNPGEVDLLIDGVAGQMWDLVYSDVLPAHSWDYLTTITLTNDHHIYRLSLPNDHTEEYYRLRQP